ncbi:MAG: hypothetical protein Tsb0015_09680 [Simkaniaceae bacterium]
MHNEQEYSYLLDEHDREMLPWLQLFSKYDLYSKNEEAHNPEKLRPFYQDLIAEFFPEKIS